jgi:dCMP deaminase
VATEEEKETMSIPDWDSYFMSMLPLIAARSKDPRTKTGCVIVNRFHNVLTTGYNGFPAGVSDTIPERWNRDNGEKYFWVEHAERNAIYAAARAGWATDGCTLYVSWLPCMDCGRAIIQSGITRVVVDKSGQEKNTSARWEADHARVLTLFSEGGVSVDWWS